MEQLIPVIEFCKKHRFWLTCGVLTVAALATWYLATSDLYKKRTQSISAINSAKSTGEKVTKTTANGVEEVVAHPNDTTEEGMDQQITDASDALLRAWKIRRDAQEPVLQWPKDVINNERFVTFFGQIDPPEAFPGLERIDQTDVSYLLDIYADKIPSRMIPLCEIIGAEWKFADETESSSSSSSSERDRFNGQEGMDDELSEQFGFGGRGGQQNEGNRGGRDGGRDGKPPQVTGAGIVNNDIVVDWNEENQDMWNQKLTTFKNIDGQRGISGTPTPFQVVMLQQDLWLLEAFFKVIKDVNGGANANDLATVKRIEHVAFGREARTQLGKLSEPDSRLADQEAASTGDTFAPDERQSRRSMFAPRARIEAGEFDPDPGDGKAILAPFHGRYVDPDFAPLKATDLVDAMTAEELPTENLELVVAKRVPFRVAIRIDERKIDDFMAACINSPFAFEIKQVRIEQELDEIQMAAFTGSGNTITRTMSRQDMQQRGEAAGPGGGGQSLGEDEGGGVDKNKGAADMPVYSRTNYDVTVEFYGIVKIYNPVNEALIKGESSDPDNAKP